MYRYGDEKYSRFCKIHSKLFEKNKIVILKIMSIKPHNSKGKKPFPHRFTRVWYEEPQPPKIGNKMFIVELLKSTGDRSHYFPTNEKYYDLDNQDRTEFTGKMPARQSLSLEEINKLVNEEKLDHKNVYLTASFDDDYLILETVHVRELSAEEQVEKFESDHSSWEDRRHQQKEYELQKIKQQIEALQKQADKISNKSK